MTNALGPAARSQPQAPPGHSPNEREASEASKFHLQTLVRRRRVVAVVNELLFVFSHIFLETHILAEAF
jgi:hypothetical protein